MQAGSVSWPDLKSLAAAVQRVAQSFDWGSGAVTVVGREPNIYLSSYLSEIVTCRLDDGRHLLLFCKYSGAGHGDSGYGHWRGVGYEGDVYKYILKESALSAPKFYGACVDEVANSQWLFMEFVEGSERLSESINPVALFESARWIAKFHRRLEQPSLATRPAFLHCYDVEYLRGWSRRTLLAAVPLMPDISWLESLCAQFENEVPRLLSAAPTIVHGEFYPKNILVRNGVIYPVDWESAAIAAGEIDIACLTEGWAKDAVEVCKKEYCNLRWPNGGNKDFNRNFEISRLYVHFRWMGDVAHSMTDGERMESLDCLKADAAQIEWLRQRHI